MEINNRKLFFPDLMRGIMKRIMLIAIGMLACAFYPTASQAAITSLNVTSITLSKSTGTITVTGTIVCTAGDGVEIQTDILQQASRGNGSFAPGSTEGGICSGGVDTWVTQTPQNEVIGSIKNGNAQIFVSAMDIADGSMLTQIFHQPITPVS